MLAKLKMELLGKVGLCGESTLLRPHRGFAVATVRYGPHSFKFMLCRNHALDAAAAVREYGGRTVVEP